MDEGVTGGAESQTEKNDNCNINIAAKNGFHKCPVFWYITDYNYRLLEYRSRHPGNIFLVCVHVTNIVYKTIQQADWLG